MLNLASLGGFSGVLGRLPKCSREGLLCSKIYVMFPAVSLGPVVSNGMEGPGLGKSLWSNTDHMHHITGVHPSCGNKVPSTQQSHAHHVPGT